MFSLAPVYNLWWVNRLGNVIRECRLWLSTSLKCRRAKLFHETYEKEQMFAICDHGRWCVRLVTSDLESTLLCTILMIHFTHSIPLFPLTTACQSALWSQVPLMVCLHYFSNNIEEHLLCPLDTTLFTVNLLNNQMPKNAVNLTIYTLNYLLYSTYSSMKTIQQQYINLNKKIAHKIFAAFSTACGLCNKICVSYK